MKKLHLFACLILSFEIRISPEIYLFQFKQNQVKFLNRLIIDAVSLTILRLWRSTIPTFEAETFQQEHKFLPDQFSHRKIILHKLHLEKVSI